MTSEEFATTVPHDFSCCNDMYFSHVLTRETGSIYFLRLLLVNYWVDLSASLRCGRSGKLFTSSRVANRLRDDNSLRLASNAGLCWNILCFDYYGFLSCLFNIAQGMRQSWDALRGEVDALDAYWGSWHDTAKIAMLKVFGIKNYVKAVLENGFQSRYEGGDALSHSRFLCLHHGGERL